MKITDYEKDKIKNLCQPLIEKFKSEYISINPNKEFNYLVDIYTKWHRESLYFCEKYNAASTNSIVDAFEEKFVRLKMIYKDNFDISYMRHTGKWFSIGSGLTLRECLEMLEDTPTLHPTG